MSISPPTTDTDTGSREPADRLWRLWLAAIVVVYAVVQIAWVTATPPQTVPKTRERVQSMSKVVHPAVGSTAPSFTLADPVTGRIFRLADRKGKDILLVFFRGTWCPFCREQMRLLTENDARLKAAGIVTIGVVCQSANSIERYLTSSPVSFPLLADEDRAVARMYGVHYWLSPEGFNLANPSLFILDRTGTITFAHRGRNMRDLPVQSVLEKFLGLLA